MSRQDLQAEMERYLGKTLKRHLFTRDGLFILPRHSVLTERHLDLLRHFRIVLSDRDVEDTPPIAAVIDQAVAEWKEVLQSARNTGQIFLRPIEQKAVPLIRRMADKYSLHSILTGLTEKDDYTYRHSVAVAILSTLIGRWLQLRKEELEMLTTAALLHDIGKTKIPSQILTKNGRLTTEEFGMIKQHTTYGYEMIRGQGDFSETHALIALEHHERLDGSGYPYGRREETHLLSRIVAVADVFHAMCSKRPYKEAHPFIQVAREMFDGAFGLYDPKVATLFVRRTMESLIGSAVQLTDGRIGTVVRIHPEELFKPLVLCDDRFVDLTHDPSLHIQSILPPKPLPQYL